MVQVKEEPQGPEAVMGVGQRGRGTQSSCSSKGWAVVTDEGGQGRAGRGGGEVGCRKEGPPELPSALPSRKPQACSGLHSEPPALRGADWGRGSGRLRGPRS